MNYVIVVTDDSLFNSRVQGLCVSDENCQDSSYILRDTPGELIAAGYSLISGPSWDPKDNEFMWTFKK